MSLKIYGFAFALTSTTATNRLYDLNNNPIEEEEWEDDGEAQMGNLDINGEHQHA